MAQPKLSLYLPKRKLQTSPSEYKGTTVKFIEIIPTGGFEVFELSGEESSKFLIHDLIPFMQLPVHENILEVNNYAARTTPAYLCNASKSDIVDAHLPTYIGIPCGDHLTSERAFLALKKPGVYISTEFEQPYRYILEPDHGEQIIVTDNGFQRHTDDQVHYNLNDIIDCDTSFKLLIDSDKEYDKRARIYSLPPEVQVKLASSSVETNLTFETSDSEATCNIAFSYPRLVRTHAGFSGFNRLLNTVQETKFSKGFTKLDTAGKASNLTSRVTTLLSKYRATALQNLKDNLSLDSWRLSERAISRVNTGIHFTPSAFESSREMCKVKSKAAHFAQGSPVSNQHILEKLVLSLPPLFRTKHKDKDYEDFACKYLHLMVYGMSVLKHFNLTSNDLPRESSRSSTITSYEVVALNGINVAVPYTVISKIVDLASHNTLTSLVFTLCKKKRDKKGLPIVTLHSPTLQSMQDAIKRYVRGEVNSFEADLETYIKGCLKQK